MGDAASDKVATNAVNTITDMLGILGINEAAPYTPNPHSAFQTCTDPCGSGLAVTVAYTLDGADVPPISGPQALAMILAAAADMARQAIAKSCIPQATPMFCIAVPATFGPAQLRAVGEAAEVAGLAVGQLQVVTAPEAVAACYAARHAGDISEARTVAFLNMGHSVTQISAYEFSPPAAAVAIASEDTTGPAAGARPGGGAITWRALAEPVCLPQVCGGRLDQAVFDEYRRQVEEKYGIAVRPGTKQGFRLMQVCRKARVVLSANKTSTIQLECFGPDEKDILFTVDRGTLERICAPARDALVTALQELLAASEIPVERLNGLELVGGVTCTPFVQAAVAPVVGGADRIRQTMDRASAVAVGAAYAGDPGAVTRFCVVPPSALPPETIAGWRALQVAMEAQDAVLAAIAQARNDLESYVFATRDAGETQQPELFNDEQTLPLLTAAEDWLYSEEAEEAQEATVITAYLAKLQDKVRALNVEWDAAVADARAKAEEAARAESARLEAQRLAEAAAQGGEDHDFRRMKKADRMKYVLKNKAEATELFKGGNYAHATQRYIKALAHAGKFVDIVTDEEKKEVEALTLTLHLNLALVYIKQDANKKALASAENALQIDPASAKALYRKAVALESLKDYREALKALKAGAAAAPEDSAIAKAQARIQAKLTAETNKEKRAYSKMFG